MEYHADRDSYICRNGRELTVTNERRSKTASGYVSVKTYYRSPDCTGCPYKTECIKGNNCKTPMEKRNKVLMVSKTMSQKRAEDLERITSEYGTMLRMNRSIQAEGSFADVKEDMNFEDICTEEKQMHWQRASFWRWDETSISFIARFRPEERGVIFFIKDSIDFNG